MHWVAKVQQAIDHIEDHLNEELSAEAVGQAIHYAPSSFANLFSALTGYSVGEYIRFRRLSLAAEELAQDRLSITDAALQYGYESPEAFAKAFKRLFGCAPSKVADVPRPQRFQRMRIDYRLNGGFSMARNWIPGLRRVDWSDPQRQNEFVNSVVSALTALGESVHYDAVCALSGCAFRTSFSMPSAEPWNHGNYHVIHTPPVIEHTFRMLGWRMTHHVRGEDYAGDRQLIVDSIDRGVPVITLEGVINCADACVISGYDNDGDVLLGYNPFMDIEDDHKEAPDDTGYFRKSGWHKGFFANGSLGRILILEGKAEKPSKAAALEATLALLRRLIGEECLAPGQYNGLAAHRAFARALQTYDWEDTFDPYLNTMCNQKQYLDRQYAVPFFREHGREDLAAQYEKIAAESRRMAELVPQDFSAGYLFEDRQKLAPFCDTVLRIADLEEQVLDMIG